MQQARINDKQGNDTNSTEVRDSTVTVKHRIGFGVKKKVDQLQLQIIHSCASYLYN